MRFFFNVFLVFLLSGFSTYSFSELKYGKQDNILNIAYEEEVSSLKKFVFVVPSYNNTRYCEKNLTSILSQNYENFRVIYIDDASTDNAVVQIKNCIAEYHMAHKVTLVENTTRHGMMANRYDAIHLHCKDDDICIMLDGDDWLIPDADILSFYNKIYSDPEIWATYGQYVEYPSAKVGIAAPYRETVILRNEFRKHNFVAMHLRTFYAWMFKLIKAESFIHKGAFIQMTTDWAIMYPILEMAGFHTACISKITCVYNKTNPLSSFKKKSTKGGDCGPWIKAQQPYRPLAKKPSLPLKTNNYKRIDSSGYVGVIA